MRSLICGVCFALTAATPTASGQIILQDQFLHGGNTAAGEYVVGHPDQRPGPQGGSLIGFADAWVAPVSEDNCSAPPTPTRAGSRTRSARSG
jgi:hypothetical protein